MKPGRPERLSCPPALTAGNGSDGPGGDLRGRRASCWQSAGAFPVAQSRALPDGRAHGFAALANIGVLRAGRAQPLYLLVRKYRRSAR